MQSDFLVQVMSRAALFADGDPVSSTVSELGKTPYFVLAGYLVLLLVLGIYGWRKSRSGEVDYYLAGREQGWLVSSLTIMATFFSSFALLGAPGMVYREGVVFALFSLNVPVAGLCVYLLGARIWRLGRRFGYITPGDMISDYYGSKASLRLLVALAGFLYAIPYVVIQIRAGGIVSANLFGEDAFALGAGLLALITMVYIMIGGMRSVAWTDAIQGLLLITGMLVAGFAMFLVFGGPGDFTSRVNEELPESSLTAPGNTASWSWTLVFTVCVLASTGSMIQPAQWMRYYSASSVKTLQRGAMIFGIVLTSCFILGVMLIGLAGQVLYPLKFEHSVAIAHEDSPAQLDKEIPEEVASQFRYDPPQDGDGQSPGKLTWSWVGKQSSNNNRALDNDQAARLSALSEAPSFKQAVAELKSKVNSDERPEFSSNERVKPTFDAILVVVLNEKLPQALGSFGAIFASLLLVAIMAASMSTADSNLHALSAVLTRDVYDQYVRPQASQRERVWVGRGIIVAATVAALAIVIASHDPESSTKTGFMKMIAEMGLMAIAFSAQLLPIAIDILFVRKGTGPGAAAGLAAGLFGAFLFGSLFGVLNSALGHPELLEGIVRAVSTVKSSLNFDGVSYFVHGSVWGLVFNVPVFVLVSLLTRKVPQQRRAEFAAVMRGDDLPAPKEEV